MKKLHVILITMLFVFLGCDESDTIQRVAQEKLLKEGTAQTGMPAIVNFRERKLLKMILELRDQEKLITYVYIVDLNANLKFLGKAIGYPIPYSTQYSNPMKQLYQTGTIPQADPNGIFSPSSAEGTWVMLLDPKDSTPHPVYIEPKVIASPFPLK